MANDNVLATKSLVCSLCDIFKPKRRQRRNFRIPRRIRAGSNKEPICEMHFTKHWTLPCKKQGRAKYNSLLDRNSLHFGWNQSSIIWHSVVFVSFRGPASRCSGCPSPGRVGVVDRNKQEFICTAICCWLCGSSLCTRQWKCDRTAYLKAITTGVTGSTSAVHGGNVRSRCCQESLFTCVTESRRIQWCNWTYG